MSPVEFADIGKFTRDLLDKEYNFGQTKVELKSTTHSGVTFTTTLDRNNHDGALKGELKGKFEHKETGVTFTETYNTNNDLNLKAETEPADGVKLELDTSFNPYSAKKEVKAGFSYKNDVLRTTTKVNVLESPTLTSDLTLGTQGFIVGGQVVADVAQKSLKNFNLGLGYSDKDYALSLNANKSFNQFVLGYYHNVNSSTSVGATAVWGFGDKSLLIQFGGSYKVDRDTTFKAKVDSSGRVGLGYAQRIRQDTKATFGLLIDTRNLDQNAHKLGFALNFEP